MNLEAIDPAQRDVARRFLEDESRARRHLVIYLSGSHAYGFPSPDSDLDLKAAHVAPTRDLVGLSTPTPTRNRLEVIDGVEIDYTSNEIGAVLRGVLRGNGNYLERLLGPLRIDATDELCSLEPLVRAAVSRNVHGHYAGFARSQLERARAAEAPTAKKILYVLRTALTGTHLLRSGELVVDLRELLDEYGFGDARELIAVKRAGERTALAAGDASRWWSALDRAMAGLDEARDASPLPAGPNDGAALEAWLVDLRGRCW